MLVQGEAFDARLGGSGGQKRSKFLWGDEAHSNPTLAAGDSGVDPTTAMFSAGRVPIHVEGEAMEIRGLGRKEEVRSESARAGGSETKQRV